MHSPFVYNLLTKCIYPKSEKPAHIKIKSYRHAVLNDSQLIKVTDFGAGSRVFNSENRRVGAIAKNAGISEPRAILLNKLTSYFQFQSGLEIGTSVGIAAAAIAQDNPIQLVTLEGCPETAGIAREYFEKFNLKNIELRVGKFDELLKKFTENTEKQPLDLIYFDGNHQKTPTLKYFEAMLPLAHNDSVFIFDDIHWSKDMEEAWEEIKKHPKVRISIDSFYWGIVFFRKEQEKEHFTIRL